MLLSLINRPSFAISACTVPPKEIFLEAGFLNQNLRLGGNQQNGPNAAVRLGLTNRSELVFVPPNQIRQTVEPYSGNTVTMAAFKSRLYYTKNFILTGEIDFAPPSGTINFGSPHTQGVATIILFWNLTKKISFQLQTGLGSFCDPEIFGGNCFQSLIPDIVLNYNLNKKWAVYYEGVLQSKINSSESYGVVNGLGLLYLFRPSIVLDVEYYRRIRGAFNYVDFYGIGFSKLFE